MSAAFEIEAKMVAATLSEAALVAFDWLDTDPAECVLDDLASLRSGATSVALLAECLDASGDEADIADGWRDYVAALEAHLAKDGANVTPSTPAEKRAVIERIHAAWVASPHQRLGQLIANACRDKSIFYTEDTTLAELCETFVKEHAR